MASRLSSLLVRDGLVSVKRMERAFQRQVIYGGALDTILLEMKLVPEDRLAQYLSLANGLPPASDVEADTFDTASVDRCPRPIADKYNVVPLAFDDDAMRILVRDGVDVASLEQLANELNLPIQPLVVPEYRFQLAMSHRFGDIEDARFVRVRELAAESRTLSPVGRGDTVIVDAGATRLEPATMRPVEPPEPEPEPEPAPEPAYEPPPVAHDSSPGRSTTMEMSTDAIRQHMEEMEREAESSYQRHGRRPSEAPEPAPEPAPAPEAAPVPVAARTAEAVPREIRDDSNPRPVRGRETPGWSGSPLVSGDGGEQGPPVDVPPGFSALYPSLVRGALDHAHHRDDIFTLLLRGLLHRTTYAGLLTVQGGAAIGRLAIANGELDVSVREVLIPLDVETPFRQAVETASPYIGRIRSSDPEIDGMIARLGGSIPPSALLLPIALRGRVVALAIAHRGTEPVSIAQLSELLPLAGAAANAVSRLLVRAKARSTNDRPEPAAKETADDEPEEAGPGGGDDASGALRRKRKRQGRDTTPSGQRAVRTDPETAKMPPLHAAQMDAVPEPDPDPDASHELEPISRVFDRIEQSDLLVSETAMQEAMYRMDETLAYLSERFPGKLRATRYETPGRVPRASQHGTILDLVTRLGVVTADLLIVKMRDESRDVRYYATLCAAELRPLPALPGLVERLFDTDFAIRTIAIEALAGYPTRELDSGLDPARLALHSEVPSRVKAAADAFASLGDIHAIPDLLDAHGRQDAGSEPARRALVAITKQDFGTSTKKWRAWWNKHKLQSRIEWMVEGLSHRDGAIRQSSVEELRKLTGEYFGYHHDLPKREREQARQRWIQWWNEVGRRRFLRQGEPERNRPTAVLPKRDTH